MSTITKEFTKEQLHQIEAAAKEALWPVVWSEKKAREHFSEKITPKVVLKLARITLASLEAEPIYQLWDEGFYDTEKETYDAVVNAGGAGGRGRIVYTAPPAPVVPEEMPKGLAGQIVCLLAHNIGDKFLAQKIWNACRDAMLQGAELVTTAYKLPDAWVDCSERMPEQFVEVLACTEDGGRYIAALNQRMAWDDGDFFDDIQDVTHWQPLPSPPAK